MPDEPKAPEHAAKAAVPAGPADQPPPADLAPPAFFATLSAAVPDGIAQASDWPTRPQRFDVIYCLYSTRHHHRVRVKARAAELEGVPSASGIWPGANW